MKRGRFFLANFSFWLSLLLSLFSFAIFAKPQPVSAADYFLNWGDLGFVDGTSAPQTFTNIDGSGINMTIEFRVVDENFVDIGPYIPGTGQIMPKIEDPTDEGYLAVRDISSTNYPNAGYILTKMSFSENIKISGDLWMEAIFNWQAGGTLKYQALQAFSPTGAGVVPVSWTTYGGSDMISETHPENGELWFRSSYPVTQTTYSGVENINYGNQAIKELHWYSWGYDPADGTTLRNLLGSTYLGNFRFSSFPTAVTLVNLGATDKPAVTAPFLVALLPFGLATIFVVRRGRKSAAQV